MANAKSTHRIAKHLKFLASQAGQRLLVRLAGAALMFLVIETTLLATIFLFLSVTVTMSLHLALVGLGIGLVGLALMESHSPNDSLLIFYSSMATFVYEEECARAEESCRNMLEEWKRGEA